MKAFQQSMTENSYSRQEEVTLAESDCGRRMRLAAMLTRAALYGAYDYDARGLTYEKFMELGQVFLLSRFAVKVHDCPRAEEVLTGTTWENGVRGAQMQRVYELADETGRVRVSMKSDWILIDPESRKILRPSAFTAKKLYICSKDIDCPEPQRLTMPAAGTEELGMRRVVWSDLDGNGHLFSGRYGDVVWDALPADLQPRLLRSFQINFNREATLGQTLGLVGCRQGNTYHMEGVGPNGVCFNALCEF